MRRYRPLLMEALEGRTLLALESISLAPVAPEITVGAMQRVAEELEGLVNVIPLLSFGARATS